MSNEILIQQINSLSNELGLLRQQFQAGIDDHNVLRGDYQDAIRAIPNANLTFTVDVDGDDNGIGDINEPLSSVAEAIKRTPWGGRCVIRLMDGDHKLKTHVQAGNRDVLFLKSDSLSQNVSITSEEFIDLDGRIAAGGFWGIGRVWFFNMIVNTAKYTFDGERGARGFISSYWQNALRSTFNQCLINHFDDPLIAHSAAQHTMPACEFRKIAGTAQTPLFSARPAIVNANNNSVIGGYENYQFGNDIDSLFLSVDSAIY